MNPMLPRELESELELARVVGGSGLAGGAQSDADAGSAGLVDRSDVGAIQEIKGIGEEIKVQPLAERDALADAQIDGEEARAGEGVAAEIAVATSADRGEAGHDERSAVIGETNIGHPESDARNEG